MNNITFLITDTYYHNENCNVTDFAKVAGIRFKGIEVNYLLSKHVAHVDGIADYESGQFYKREMPCILALLNNIKEDFDCIIIDGYVFLDGFKQAGLGKHLYDNLSIKKPIIGIAKNKYAGIGDEYAVYRGISKHPLYVTSIGMDTDKAKATVKKLAGDHRLPTIINQVDKLSRQLNDELI